MSQPIFIPAIYEGSRDLKDRTKKLVFETNIVTPEQAGNLQTMVGEFVYLAVKKEDFSRSEVDLISNLKSDYEDHTKTPAQRLRAVLYRVWELNNEGYMDFNLFYNFRIEQLINHFKAKLP
jgi:hypothetical protein